MADEYTITKGFVAFIYGLIGSVLSWYIVPIFFSIIPSEATILTAGAWTGLVLIWILAVAVRPIYIIRKALQK
jgi:hypothetical protein